MRCNRSGCSRLHYMELMAEAFSRGEVSRVGAIGDRRGAIGCEQMKLDSGSVVDVIGESGVDRAALRCSVILE